MQIGAVLLAAGKSERMGHNKLLLSLDGKKLVDNILDALADSGVDERVVVVGHEPDQVVEAVKHRMDKVKIALNVNYENGMTSSFQTGLHFLRHVDAAFLVLGDEPIFDSKIISSLIGLMEKNHMALIVSPVYKGKKGHPLLFRSQLFTAILDLKSSQTIRDVVHRHVDRLVTIEAPQWTTSDIDTPEDYRRISDFMKTNQVR